jgi:tRNA pseudouridine55 synthase
VELKARTVTIREFELTEIAMPDVSFRVVCTKGTYIRSLARDLGTALDSGGYLTSLCRTRSGDFKLADAWELDKLPEYIAGL